MPLTFQPCVMGSWAVVISRALNYYQIDGPELLSRVDIDPAIANQLDTRYRLSRIDRLWRLARNLTGDEAIGLTVARYMRPTSWHALGFAIWASDTLMDGFQRLADNLRMFADHSEMILTVQGGEVEIDHGVRKDLADITLAPEQVDAFIGTCVLTARHIYSPDFSPEGVWLSRPQPEDPTPWQRLFKCPVYFNARRDRILFNTRAMSQPLLTASPELAAQNDALVADYLARLDRSDLVTRLQSLLVQHEPIGHMNVQDVARHLNLSQRTLQRRLQEKQLSYKQVVDEVRQQQALHWLRLDYLSISEIGYRLGFSNGANFTRAFKRWYGEPPARVRRSLK